MKTALLSTAAMAATLLAACGPSAEEQQAARDKAIADSLNNLASMERPVMVDLANSTVTWHGIMAGVKDHKGTVKLTEGTLTIKGTAVTGGSFVADMNSIASVQDQFMAPPGSEKGTSTSLDAHLKSPDFFDAAGHPTASFTITSVAGNTATGNLTVRGKTHEEKVTDILVVEEGGMVKASGKLVFDRQKYEVAWSSGAPDAVLSDNIELEVTLVGKPAM